MLQAGSKSGAIQNGEMAEEGRRETVLRVLLIAASLDTIGGQAVQAKRLLEAFAEGETRVELGFLPNNPRLTSFLGFFQRFKYLRTIVTSIKFLALLLREMHRFDMVQVFSASNTSYVISTLPPLIVAKLFRKKIILNYHSGEARDHLKRWKPIVNPTLRLFDALVVPSEFLVKVFAEFGFQAQAIHNFVDADSFAFRLQEELRPVFLSNRNLEPLYNVECILRAFALIQEKRPEAELLIAGEGRERRRLETLARELKLKNVEFLGEVSPDRMPELYHRAGIYLNSSNVDNMPLSIIEAFACGVPVVSTNAGGIPFLVEHEKTGLLVEREDCRALASEALRLLEDRNLAEEIMLRAGRICRENYSWASVRDRWLKLYADLAVRDLKAKPAAEEPLPGGR